MDETRFTRLPELLAPYRLAAIADATGRSKQASHAWQRGDSLPDVASVPALARFLRISIEELMAIIAADAADREEQRRAIKVGA